MKSFSPRRKTATSDVPNIPSRQILSDQRRRAKLLQASVKANATHAPGAERNSTARNRQTQNSLGGRWRRQAFVRNMTTRMNNHDLKHHFSYFGKVVNASIIRNTRGQSMCRGFVEFETETELREALEHHQHWIRNKCVRVEAARPPRYQQHAEETEEFLDMPDYDYLSVMQSQHEELSRRPAEAFEKKLDGVFEAVRDALRTVSNEVHPVGSFARDTHTEHSDIDIACLFPKHAVRTRHAFAILKSFSKSVRYLDDYLPEEDDTAKHSEPTEGATVFIHSLQIAHALNGEYGVCKSWDARAERWCVLLRNGETKSIKKQNLLIVEEELGASAAATGESSWEKPTSFAYKDNCHRWTDSHTPSKWDAELPLADLRYTHDTIKATFSDGTFFSDLVAALMRDPEYHLNCPKLWLKAFKYGEMTFVLNNRRLWCLNECKTRVPGRQMTARVWYCAAPNWWMYSSVSAGLSVRIRAGDFAEDDCQDDGPKHVKVQKPRGRGDVIHLDCDGVSVDVVVGAVPPKTCDIGQLVLDEDFDKRFRWKAAVVVEQSKIRWTEQICNAIRLAKIWIQKVAFPYWIRRFQPIGLLVELLVNHAAERKAAEHNSPWEIFIEWLRLCSEDAPPCLLSGWDAAEVDADWGTGPRVLDPKDPTNNLARSFKKWGHLKRYAKRSLELLRPCHPFQTTFRSVPAQADAPEENVAEVWKHLGELQVPSFVVEALIRMGYSRLQQLCDPDILELGDLKTAGLVHAEARRVLKECRPGGYLYIRMSSPNYNPQPEVASRNSQGSDCSFISAEGNKCFVKGTLFEDMSGRRIRVEDLDQGSRVCAEDDHHGVLVFTITCHAERRRHLVKLTSEQASTVFTSDHRIVMEDGTTKEAAQVNEGERVLVTGRLPDPIVATDHFIDTVTVFEIVFRPDKPVRSFIGPDVEILSLGQASTSSGHVDARSIGPERRRGGTRRSGMNRRWERSLWQAWDADPSMPDTFDEFR